MSCRPAATAAVLALLAIAPAVAQPRSGQAVYEEVCKACHATGELGSPKLGDTKAWKPLIAEGQAMLSRTSIKGIRKMPAKGGRPDLSDLEVKRAVVYMANAGGAKWTEPAK
ncbi:MAG: c-type cytochrome [Burkholderiales bacterium]|jgi:cytochrome c5